MAPSPAHVKSMTAKAVATLARTDGISVAPDAVEFVRFNGPNSGQYLIVRDGDEVLAIYKVQVRPGPARAERQADGGVIYMVNSLSIGLKRIKRPPKGLLP